MGDVRSAHLIVLKHEFCIVFNLLRCVCAAFSNIMLLYSIMGRINAVYNLVRVRRSPPHSVLVNARRIFMRCCALEEMSVMCCLNVSPLSNVIPRNFAVVVIGMSVLSICIGLQSSKSSLPKVMHCVFCGDSVKFKIISLS